MELVGSYKGQVFRLTSSSIQLRKAKALQLNNKITKIGDLKVYQLATSVARCYDCVTEQVLMTIGGELFELKRHALSQIKIEDSKALQLKVALAERLQAAERQWRERLIGILEKGRGGLPEEKNTTESKAKDDP